MTDPRLCADCGCVSDAHDCGCYCHRLIVIEPLIEGLQPRAQGAQGAQVERKRRRKMAQRSRRRNR